MEAGETVRLNETDARNHPSCYNLPLQQ